MTAKPWAIVLGRAAEDDVSAIAAWTVQTFGPRQAELYVEALLDTIEELSVDPLLARSKPRPEIGAGLRTLHMAKSGRRGRHFILYQAADSTVSILRILHDSMELSRHVPGTGD